MPVLYGSMMNIPPTNLLLAAEQEPYKKKILLMKNTEEFSLERVQKNGQQAEKKKKTETVTGLGRRTREEIAKQSQMTALRFQTGGRHQTSLASLWGK